MGFMPRISDQRKAERRTQILRGAWICFQKQGLHATTMDDIIRQCGLSAGAVYSYFPSKDELIFAAVTTSLSQLAEQMRPVLVRAREVGPDQTVRDTTSLVAEFSQGDGYDLKRIALLGWSEAQRDEKLRALMQSFYRAFRDGLTGCVPAWKEAGLIDTAARDSDVGKTLMCVILGFVVQAALLGDVEPDEIRPGLSSTAPGGKRG